MSHCCAYSNHASVPARRSDGLFATIFKLMLLWVVLVFAGGTLTKVNHPVASEVGQLIRVVTLVDPAIRLAQGNQWDNLAYGLRVIADGAPIG